MRLLLAEDDVMLGRALSKALSEAGYVVSWHKDGEAAELAALYEAFDVAIFDVNLPRQSGLKVLGKLRRNQQTLPVLILTALDTPPQRVEGLDLGADDYLTKPFDLDELLARLRAIVRRHHGKVENKLTAADVEYDPASMQVKKAGVVVALQPKELKVLALLLQSKGKPVSKTQIETSIYDDLETFESNTVEVLIYSLRKKLGQDFIKTQRSVGYMIPA